jgi:MFS transporter, DHA2 family, methylenomycin A resistance protein
MEVKRPWFSYLGLLFGTFVVIEAMAFQIPAMPVLTEEFGIPVAIAGLISLFYYMGHTVFAPMFGNIADKVGRKKIIMLGLTIFVASEFIAAMSINFPMFLAARLAQGIGAACVVPASLAYASFLFPAEKRGMPLGIAAAIGTLGAAAGGILGGLLIKSFGWQSIYLVSGTLSLLGMILIYFTLPETPKRESNRFDYAGSVLLFLSVGLLLSVTTLIANLGISSPYTIIAMIAGLIFIISFVWVEKRKPNPLINLSFLKNRKFIIPLSMVFIMGVCYQGILYTNAFFVTSKPGGGPELSGMMTMYVYLAGAVAGLIGGKLVDILKTKTVILTSVVIFILGTIMYSTYSSSTPFWYIVTTVVIIVFGFCMMAPACMKMALTVIPEKELSGGSGTYTMIRDLGNPTGQTTMLAVFGTLSASSLAGALRDQAEKAGVGSSLTTSVEKAGLSGGANIDSALTDKLTELGITFQQILDAAKLEGMVSALNTLSYLVIVLSIIVFGISFFLPKDPSKHKESLILTSNLPVEESKI